jgi:hypothetical protein
MTDAPVFQVEFRRSAVTVACDANTNIWHAARPPG